MTGQAYRELYGYNDMKFTDRANATTVASEQDIGCVEETSGISRSA